jgi:predicted GNAT family acetyltransferase
MTVPPKPSDFDFEATPKGGRYFMVMPNGEQSELTFFDAGPGHIVADHTFVPVPYRGEGVAEAMAQRFFTDARQAGNRVTPACWFVAGEFRRLSPEWDDILKG